MGKTEIEKTIKAGAELLIGFIALGFGIALLTFWWIARGPIIIAIDEMLDPRIEYIERDYRRKWEFNNSDYDNVDFGEREELWNARQEDRKNGYKRNK